MGLNLHLLQTSRPILLELGAERRSQEVERRRKKNKSISQNVSANTASTSSRMPISTSITTTYYYTGAYELVARQLFLAV